MIAHDLKLLCLFSFFFLYSCTERLNPVLPGTDGINRITLRNTNNPKIILKTATLTAESYCKSAMKKAILLSTDLFNSDKIREQQVFDESLNLNQFRGISSPEVYLEFVCN